MNEVVAVSIKTKIEMIAMKENKVKVCLEAVERAKGLLKIPSHHLRVPSTICACLVPNNGKVKVNVAPLLFVLLKAEILPP
jgi:hypothetical protein